MHSFTLQGTIWLYLSEDEDNKILFVPKQSKRDLRKQSLANKIDGIIKIREERKANLELRFGTFRIPRPRDSKKENCLISIPLFVVDDEY